MNDTEILKKLYTLQGLKSPESDEFIAEWIKSITIAIAEDSRENIGFGSGIKTIKKYIKANDKAGNGFGGMLRTSKPKIFILTNAHFAVKAGASFQMPIIEDKKGSADSLLEIVENAGKTNKEPLILPTRAELDLEIKKWKATPKDKRKTKFPVYDFGEDLPRVNAEYLFDLLALVPMAQKCYIEGKNKKLSRLYIKYSPFEIVLMPVNK